MDKPFQKDSIAELPKGQSTREDMAQRFGALDEIAEANGYKIFIDVGTTVSSVGSF